MSKTNTSKTNNNFSISTIKNQINPESFLYNDSEVDNPLYSWKTSDDSKLCSLIYQYGTNNWEVIAKEMNNNKSPIQCLHRWNSIMKPNYIKGPWNVEEDKKLIDWIKTNGPTNWSACAEYIPGRTGKQCRERWINALNPLLKKGSWEPEEDYIIFKLFKKLGSKWSTISNYIDGRTENSIKNRFYSTLRRLACESKKNEKGFDLKFDEDFDDKEAKLSLKNLMLYFDQAYYEKTKYIDNLISGFKLNESEVLNSSVLKEILQMNRTKDNGVISVNESESKEKQTEIYPISNIDFINKKRLPITHQTNNNYNVNICISAPNSNNIDDREANAIKQNLFNKNQPTNPSNNLTESVSAAPLKKDEFKNMSLEMLANKIDSFCVFTQNLNMTVKKPEADEEEKPKKAVDAEKIGNLLNQLNDLENLLMMTKNELKKIDQPNYCFGYSDKIQTNLAEFEMPLNASKVIIKEDEEEKEKHS